MTQPTDDETPRPPDRASFREGMAFAGVNFVAMAVLAIGSAIAVARVYGASVVGQFALATAPINATWFLSTVKEGPALVKELSVLPARSPRVMGLWLAVFAFSFSLTLVVTIISAVVCWIVFNGPMHRPEIFAPALVNLVGYLVVTNTCINYDYVLSGFRAGRQLFWIRLHMSLSFLTAAVVLGLTLGTVWGLVGATMISWATTLVHRLIVVRRFMDHRISRDEARAGMRELPGILRFGLKVAPGGVADGVSNECGTWILGFTSPIAAVGAYNRAWTLGRRLLELNTRIIEVLFPTLVERHAAGDREGFDIAFMDSLRYSASGLLLPAAAAGGAAHGVMDLYGRGFSPAADALSLILLMPVLLTLSNIQRHALYAVDRPWTTTASSLLRMVVTLGCAIPLGVWLGATGVALAIVIGLLVTTVFYVSVTRSHLSRPMHALWSARQLGALLLAYGGGFGAARLVDDAVAGIVGLLTGLAAGSLVYAMIFLALGGFNDRDRRRFGDVKRRVGNRRKSVPLTNVKEPGNA